MNKTTQTARAFTRTDVEAFILDFYTKYCPDDHITIRDVLYDVEHGFPLWCVEHHIESPKERLSYDYALWVVQVEGGKKPRLTFLSSYMSSLPSDCSSVSQEDERLRQRARENYLAYLARKAHV